MWLEIHQYVTDGVVQRSCPPALIIVKEHLDFSHGLSGQFDCGIVEAGSRIGGLRNKGGM